MGRPQQILVPLWRHERLRYVSLLTEFLFTLHNVCIEVSLRISSLPGSIYNDLWKFNISGNIWQLITGNEFPENGPQMSGWPGARGYFAYWVPNKQSTSSIYVFGGYGVGGDSQTGNLY